MDEDDDEKLFIYLVRQNICIWKINSKLYKRTDLKRIAWSNISESTGRTVDDCSALWTKLRRKYMRERKYYEGKTGEEGEYKEKWRHFDNLSFLQDVIKCRGSYSNLQRNRLSERASEHHLEVDIQDRSRNPFNALNTDTLDNEEQSECEQNEYDITDQEPDVVDKSYRVDELENSQNVYPAPIIDINRAHEITTSVTSSHDISVPLTLTAAFRKRYDALLLPTQQCSTAESDYLLDELDKEDSMIPTITVPTSNSAQQQSKSNQLILPTRLQASTNKPKIISNILLTGEKRNDSTTPRKRALLTKTEFVAKQTKSSQNERTIDGSLKRIDDAISKICESDPEPNLTSYDALGKFVGKLLNKMDERYAVELQALTLTNVVEISRKIEFEKRTIED